eukprot:764820-Hanusia_phi.AAC.6
MRGERRGSVSPFAWSPAGICCRSPGEIRVQRREDLSKKRRGDFSGVEERRSGGRRRGGDSWSYLRQGVLRVDPLADLSDNPSLKDFLGLFAAFPVDSLDKGLKGLR